MQTINEITENYNVQIKNMARCIGNMQGHTRATIEQLQRIADALPTSLQRTELHTWVTVLLNHEAFIEFCWSRRSEKLNAEELYNEWCNKTMRSTSI